MSTRYACVSCVMNLPLIFPSLTTFTKNHMSMLSGFSNPLIVGLSFSMVYAPIILIRWMFESLWSLKYCDFFIQIICIVVVWCRKYFYES